MALSGCISQTNLASHNISDLHRLYDMTPVSETNPIVAEVTDCNIEIPVNELRAYVNAMPNSIPVLPNGSKRPLLTLEQKRAVLDKLVDEHFLMWIGYQEKADQNPDVTHLLNVTKGMLMDEALIALEIGENRADYAQAYQKLLDRIFNQTDFTVSNNAYDKLKSALKLLQSAEAASPAQTNFLSDPNLNKLPPSERQAVIDSVQNALRPSILNKLTPEIRDCIFARCDAGFVTVGNVLEYYQKIPADKRPDLKTRDGLNQILEQMFEKSLLTEEAQKHGLDKSPMVLEKLQLNRNMLVRLYTLNQIADEAMAQSKTPGEQARVKQWYQDHLKDRYTYKDDSGNEQVISLDQQYERIENDYIDDLREKLRNEHLHAIRAAHKVEVNEDVLEKIVL